MLLNERHNIVLSPLNDILNYCDIFSVLPSFTNVQKEWPEIISKEANNAVQRLKFALFLETFSVLQ